MPKSLKVLILDAEHPDEWPAGLLYDALRKNPVPGVEVVLANDWSYTQPLGKEGRRQRLYQGYNLTTTFPGDPNGNPGQQRAHVLTQMINQADLAISVHGVETQTGSFLFYGPNANSQARGVASMFSIENVVVSTRPPLLSYFFDNLVGLDLARQDAPMIDQLIKVLPRIVAGDIPKPKARKEFKHEGNIIGLEAIKAGIPRRLSPFSLLTEQQVRALGRTPPLYVIACDADAYEERTGGIWGELAAPYKR